MGICGGKDIDEQIPAEAKLPGSPNLTDQMAHLLKQYNELKAERDEANHLVEYYQRGVSRALRLLGADPTDWADGAEGIEAAVKSNLQIGSDDMKTREDWCDDDWNLEGTITERLFELTQQVTKLQDKLDIANQRAAKAVEQSRIQRDVIFAVRNLTESDMPENADLEKWFWALNRKIYKITSEALDEGEDK